MKTYYILYILLLSITLGSCDLMGDVDKVKPYYKLEDETAIRDANSAEQVLKGIYTQWRQWDFCSFRANMSILSGAMSVTASGGILGQTGFADNNVQADNEIIGNVYNQLYAVINAANFMIEYLENNKVKDLDPIRLQEILGEGRFHRAMAHFTLLRLFGQFYDLQSPYGIVISDQPYREVHAQARATVTDCYKFIETDLDSAILHAPEMPMSDYQPTHALISSTTAKAFKAKVLLSKGDYANAALLAEEVIESAVDYGYYLENYMDIFNNMFYSPEVLFAPYTAGYDESCNFDLSRLKYSTYTMKLADAMDPEPGNPEDGSGYDPRFVETLLLPEVNIVAFQNGKYPHNFNEDFQSNTYYFFRLGEVYYIHAEAEARQGGAHLAVARNSLQAVLDVHAPGLTDVGDIADDELLEAIRRHKWLDLVCENYEEWFDLVRYYKAGDLDITTVRPNITTDRQLILPITKTTLAGNNLLIQNP